VNRKVHHDYYKADELMGLIKSKGETINSFALVFGREESGLTNDEPAQCDLVSHLPARMVHPSLNPAQAVMVYAYLLNTENIQVSKPPTYKPQPSESAVLREKQDYCLQGLVLVRIKQFTGGSWNVLPLPVTTTYI